MDNYRIISSDNHVYEPADLWTSRIEPKFREQAPRIVHEEDGGDWWFCGGQKLPGVGSGTQTGRRFEEPEKLTVLNLFEDVRPGGYIPEEHVKDMDTDGVDVSILYPNVGIQLFQVPDSELLTAMFRVYNDWLAEFCQTSPKRLKGIAMVNIDDVQVGIKEMERYRKKGFIGAMITAYPPQGRRFGSPEYEPLWAAAQDLEMPLGLHVDTNRSGLFGYEEDQSGPKDHRILSVATNFDYWVRMSLSDIIFSGVFERYPKLQVGAVEYEVAWASHFLDRLDYNYTQRSHELVVSV